MILILKYWSAKTINNNESEQSRKVSRLNFPFILFLAETLKIKNKRKLQKIIETVYTSIPHDKPNLPSSFGPSMFAKPAKNR